MKGTFIISLDTELAWARAHNGTFGKYKNDLEGVRVVIDRLLGMFIRYEISATWAVVGHLFLDSCDGKHEGVAHFDPEWYKGDWFSNDPGTSTKDDQVWYGNDIIEKIRRCSIDQEIGCHSFAHILFDDPACTTEVAKSDLNACVSLASEKDLILKSFVFPKNRVGHLDLLKEAGFVCYRGRSRLPSYPREKDGLWNVPSTFSLRPHSGWRKRIPLEWKAFVAKSILGMATRENKLFHLVLHPMDFVLDERMFSTLEKIVGFASKLRKEGRLEISTMSKVVYEQG